MKVKTITKNFNCQKQQSIKDEKTMASSNMLLWSVASNQRLKELNSFKDVEIKQSIFLNSLPHVPAFMKLKTDSMALEAMEHTIQLGKQL